MRRSLPGDLELDDDPDRVDVDAVHDFLAHHSYWGRDRDRETVAHLVRGATRVVGLYHHGRQVGFARAVSDGAAFAFLADVYVLEDYRGRGLGLALLTEMIERGPYAGLRWMLRTDDAHDLYARLGFGPPDHKLMERPRRSPG